MKKKRKTKVDRLRIQSKKNNLLCDLRTKLDRCKEEVQEISNNLESTELSESEKVELISRLDVLKGSIQYYEDEIPRVELYGTHQFNTNKPKQQNHQQKKYKRPWARIILTPMGNKR